MKYLNKDEANKFIKTLLPNFESVDKLVSYLEDSKYADLKNTQVFLKDDLIQLLQSVKLENGFLYPEDFVKIYLNVSEIPDILQAYYDINREGKQYLGADILDYRFKHNLPQDLSLENIQNFINEKFKDFTFDNDSINLLIDKKLNKFEINRDELNFLINKRLKDFSETKFYEIISEELKKLNIVNNNDIDEAYIKSLIQKALQTFEVNPDEINLLIREELKKYKIDDYSLNQLIKEISKTQTSEIVKTQLNNFNSNLISKLITEKLLELNLKDGDTLSIAQIKDIVNQLLSNYKIPESEFNDLFDKKFKDLVIPEGKVSEYIGNALRDFKISEIQKSELSDYTIKNLQSKFENINSKLSTKVEIQDFDEFKHSIPDVYSKSEIDNFKNTIYTKSEIDKKLLEFPTSISVDEPVDLSNYYTKSEIDNFKNTIYTKSEIDNFKNTIYTKSEIDNFKNTIYTKSEIDAKFENVQDSNAPLNTDIFVLKSDLNTKYLTNDKFNDFKTTFDTLNDNVYHKDQVYNTTQSNERYYTKDQVNDLVYSKSEVDTKFKTFSPSDEIISASVLKEFSKLPHLTSENVESMISLATNNINENLKTKLDETQVKLIVLQELSKNPVSSSNINSNSESSPSVNSEELNKLITKNSEFFKSQEFQDRLNKSILNVINSLRLKSDDLSESKVKLIIKDYIDDNQIGLSEIQVKNIIDKSIKSNESIEDLVNKAIEKLQIKEGKVETSSFAKDYMYKQLKLF